MTQERSGPPQTPDRHEGDTVPIYAKDSWANAHIEGNKFWPQRFKAIDMFIIAAVLKDPPTSWIDFVHSRLSPEQMINLKNEMNEGHDEAGINRHTADVIEPLYAHRLGHSKRVGSTKERIVPEERLQHLWVRAKVGVVRRMLLYIDPEHTPPMPVEEVEAIDMGPIPPPSDSDAQRIQTFMDVRISPLARRRLIEAAEVILETARGEHGERLAMWHQQRLLNEFLGEDEEVEIAETVAPGYGRRRIQTSVDKDPVLVLHLFLRHLGDELSKKSLPSFGLPLPKRRQDRYRIPGREL